MNRSMVLVSLLAAAVMVGGPAAGAKVVEREHYSGTEQFTADECGFTFDAVTDFRGNYVLRETKDPEAFLVRDTFSFRAVWTNTETGKWFVIRAHAVFNEIKATHLEGTIYEFKAV